MSNELQAEASKTARVTANLASGELWHHDLKGEKMVASSSVEASSAAGVVALLRGVKPLSVAGEAAEAAIASMGGKRSGFEPVSKRVANLAGGGWWRHESKSE